MGESASDESDRAQVVARLDYRGDEVMRETLVTSLVRLPEDVRTFALTRCRFVAAADTDGSLDHSNHHCLVLRDGIDDAGVTRAVARAWLNQDGTRGEMADAEDEVNELVAQWEFTGPGADA